MHRFEWDMRYEPVGGDSLQDAGDVNDVGAVPHRSVHPARAPWAPPGRYTLRLRVSGRTLSQPLVVRLDPRVRTTAAGLARLAALTREMYDLAQAAHAAYVPADTATRALERASNTALAAALAMQDADVALTTAQVAACARARTQVNTLMAHSNRLNGQGRTR
jgi:hypothetical protein